MSNQMPEALLRREEVQRLCALSRTELWNKVARQEFPQPVATGVRSRRWKASQVQEWIASLPTAATKKAA